MPVNMDDEEIVIDWVQDPDDPWRAIPVIGKKNCIISDEKIIRIRI